MSNPIDLKGKLAFLLVTGASRGIGKKMAVEVARNFRAGSVVVLLARNERDLEKTKDEIIGETEGLKVVTRSMDLTEVKTRDLEDLAAETCSDPEDFELIMMIHNVGTIGDVKKWAKDITDYTELQSYYSVNVFTPIILNNFFLKIFEKSKKSQKFIVNVTSKAAEVPFKSFGFYCPGKAAREMFFRVLAEESPEVLVLNYSPGPVETEMTVVAQENSVATETSDMFKGLRESQTMLSTEQTTKKFLEVIARGRFKSGDHVDFYDE